VVVFHFSGHGSQVLDEVDGDEIDGLDETLVAYDSDLRGKADIIDDELNVLFQELTRKCKNVTFVMDCCHSGSNVRAVAEARRVDRPWLQKDAEKLLKDRKDRGIDVAKTKERFEGREYVLIAGCRADQLSYEHYDAQNNPSGALTFHLVNEIKRAG